jgi:hypothetical protein
MERCYLETMVSLILHKINAAINIVVSRLFVELNLPIAINLENTFKEKCIVIALK